MLTLPAEPVSAYFKSEKWEVSVGDSSSQPTITLWTEAALAAEARERRPILRSSRVAIPSNPKPPARGSHINAAAARRTPRSASAPHRN